MTHYIQEQPEQEDNFSGDEYSPNAVDDEHSPPFKYFSKLDLQDAYL